MQSSSQPSCWICELQGNDFEGADWKKMPYRNKAFQVHTSTKVNVFVRKAHRCIQTHQANKPLVLPNFTKGIWKAQSASAGTCIRCNQECRDWEALKCGERQENYSVQDPALPVAKRTQMLTNGERKRTRSLTVHRHRVQGKDIPYCVGDGTDFFTVCPYRKPLVKPDAPLIH
jgi:hypothetical protein